MSTSESFLVHYDMIKILLLSCDASPYGIGAVLSHKIPDGKEQLIAIASCSLSKREQKYAQLDKESLAIVVRVKKFHQYLFDCKFTTYVLQSQHIFAESRTIHTLASMCIQRWALILSACIYDIQCKPGRGISNANVFK